MRRAIFNSRSIYTLLILLTLTSLMNRSLAQDIPPMPAACSAPPSGYLLGGEFVMPLNTCLPSDVASTMVVARNLPDAIGLMNGVSYVFGYNDDIDITAPGFVPVYGAWNGRAYTAAALLEPGVHWVLQIGEKNGNKYLSCSTTEVIRTDPPVADIFTCNGTSVTIDIMEHPNNKHSKYEIDWGDGTIDLVDVNANPLPYHNEHNYTGTLSQVSVTGLYWRKGIEVCQTNPTVKNPNAAQAPVLDGLVAIEGGAQVRFKNYSPGVVYTMQAAIETGGSYEWIDLGVAEEGEFTASGLNKDKQYCYRIKTEDPCGNAVYSNIICEISISSTQSSSSDASISWVLPSSPSGVPQQLELLRDIEGCDDCLNQLPLYSNMDDSFDDQSLDCDNIYTYQVTARYAVIVNGVTEYITVSSEVLVINPMDASKKIIPNGLINAGYPINDDSMIKLIVHDNSESSIYNYFHKGVGDADFVSIGSATNTFDDIAINSNSGAYCYKYQVEDACGIESDLSPAFCTVFLSYKGNTLNWTDYSFPGTIITSEPAEYTIEMYNEDIGAFLPQYRTENLSQGVGQMIADSDNPKIKFRILAQQFVDLPGFTNFSIPSYSNTIEMPIPADIYIPSAFSPNGDGNNETFTIKSRFVDEGRIVIYDRWGGILFEGDLSGQGWDGRDVTQSVPVAPGNYSYKIRGFSLAGTEFARNGTVSLLK